MHDIAEFLGGHEPFTGLDEETLERLGEHAEVEFFPAGRTILPQRIKPQGRIRVIRRGAVELVDDGRPVDLLSEGEMFGHPSVLSGLPTRFEARAEEDTLCYSLPADDVIPLLGRPASLRYLTRTLLARRPKGSDGPVVTPSGEMAQQPASALVRRPPVICRPETNLREVAVLMDAQDVSGVLVALDGGEFAIVTDSDLRSKVVAGPLSPDDPVSQAMSVPIVAVGADHTGADVMLRMLDHDIRHVPVFSSNSEVLGVIVAVDLVAAETRSLFVLRRAIASAASKEELRDAASRLRETVAALHRAELPAFQVSEVISAVADAVISRMIELSIEVEGSAAGRVLLDVAGQSRPPRAGPVIRRGLGHGLAGRRSGRRLHAWTRGGCCGHRPGTRLAPRSTRRDSVERVLGELDGGLGAIDQELVGETERQPRPDRHLDPA